MTVRRRAVALLLVVGLAALVACSDRADSLDPSKTQEAVGAAVADQVEPKVTATRCTGSLEREVDATFRCTVTLQGVGKLPVTVRQVDDDGTLDVTPDAAVVTRERIVSELKASLKRSFERNFQVQCDGPTIEVRTPDSTSTCVARDANSRRKVTVTVTDASGTLAFEVGGAAN